MSIPDGYEIDHEATDKAVSQGFDTLYLRPKTEGPKDDHMSEQVYWAKSDGDYPSWIEVSDLRDTQNPELDIIVSSKGTILSMQETKDLHASLGRWIAHAEARLSGLERVRKP